MNNISFNMILNAKLNIGYLPLGRKTFDIEAASKINKKTYEKLSSINLKLIGGKKIITDPLQAARETKKLKQDGINILIIQTITFIDGQFAFAIAENWDGPIIIWSVEEPSFNGRLRLNSLTGGNLLNNVFYNLKIKVKYVHGSSENNKVVNKILDYINVIKTITYLKQSKLGVFGQYPNGYYSGEFDEVVLNKIFGIKVFRYTLDKLFKRATNIKDENAIQVINEIIPKIANLNNNTPQVIKSAKMYLTMKDFIREDELVGIAVECWPGFFEDYGAAVCGVLSLLCDEGIMSACEADLNGLISMIIQQQFSNMPSYLGDMVKINKENNSAIFWHCGAGACSLAKEKPVASVHPNRKKGLTLDFTLKEGEVTIIRLNKSIQEYRLLIMQGKALDTTNHFSGTSVEVQFENDIESVLNFLMENGIEHHYAIGYGDHTNLLKEFADKVGIDTLEV